MHPDELRAARRAAGLTQAALGALTGDGQASIAKMERGVIAVQPRVIAALAAHQGKGAPTRRGRPEVPVEELSRRAADGQRYRARRRHAGLSQAALGARCGVTRQRVQAWESGRAAVPDRAWAALPEEGHDD